VEDVHHPGISELVEAMRYFIDLSFNGDLNKRSPTDAREEISFDRRRTVSELKRTLSDRIGVRCVCSLEFRGLV
jgi:hypothetical protein